MIFAFDFHGVTLPWVENDKDIDSELFAKMISDRTGRPLVEVKYYLYGIPYDSYIEYPKDYLDFVAGKITPLKFLTLVLEELYRQHFIVKEHFETIEVEANELLEEYLRRTRIDWGVMAVIKWLVENHHDVGYLTNRTGLSMRLLEEMVPNYIEYFPLGGISSHAVFCEKPARKIYDLFHEHINLELNRYVKPEEIVLIDDMEKNLETARSIGWNTVQFKDKDQLKASLMELLKVTA